MIETKKYYVKDGEERWDYDFNPPICEVMDYWVKLGDEKIASFAYYEEAVEQGVQLGTSGKSK